MIKTRVYGDYMTKDHKLKEYEVEIFLEDNQRETAKRDARRVVTKKFERLYPDFHMLHLCYVQMDGDQKQLLNSRSLTSMEKSELLELAEEHCGIKKEDFLDASPLTLIQMIEASVKEKGMGKEKPLAPETAKAARTEAAAKKAAAKVTGKKAAPAPAKGPAPKANGKIPPGKLTKKKAAADDFADLD